MASAGKVMMAALGCAALVVAGAGLRGVTWTDVRHWGTPRNVIEVAGQTVRIPVVSGEPERLLPAVEATTVGSYSFLFPEGTGTPDRADAPEVVDAPVRYDPCQEIPYVISPAGMPAGFEEEVHRAVADVSRATGLAFAYEGFTDEPASFDRPLVQARYGNRFAPVVIGFASEREVPDLAGTVTGLGGSSAVPGAYGADRYLRAGVVIVDWEDVNRVRADGRGDTLARAVVAHELGHVVGLAHVDDDHELMHASNLSLVSWGPGDLAGLAIAGAGPCEAP